MVTTALALTFLLMPGDGTGILEARNKMPAYDDDVIGSQEDESKAIYQCQQPTNLLEIFLL